MSKTFSIQNPYIDFLREEFLEGYDCAGYTLEQWNNFFNWHISTNNVYTLLRGTEILGFAAYRPMNKTQIDSWQNEHKNWEWDITGEYLYIFALVFKKEYRGHKKIWDLMTHLASFTYPNIKYLAYEKFTDAERKLIIEEHR